MFYCDWSPLNKHSFTHFYMDVTISMEGVYNPTEKNRWKKVLKDIGGNELINYAALTAIFIPLWQWPGIEQMK